MNDVAALTTRVLDRCLACGGGELRPLGARYRWQAMEFPMVSCGACGMRFLSVQPAGAMLAAMYGEEYFASDFRCGHSEAPAADSAAFAGEHRGLLERLEALGPGRRLLDVGCAYGTLLEAARARGWQVRGVELSSAAVAHARGRGLDVTEGTLDAAALPDASADVVHMGDVLEHVPDCRATLTEVARVLAPGGHLWLRGPITTHSIARSLALAVSRARGRDLVLTEPPYHLWEFTPAPLAALVRRVGLEVVRLEQAKIPPGRPYGRKSPLQRLAMAALDAVNAPLTRWTNTLGDRVVLVAKRAGEHPPR